MKVALDTNVLAYAEGMNDELRRDVAVQIIERLPENQTFLPVQVLGELFNVLTRRGGRTAQQARDRILRWSGVFPVVNTTHVCLVTAAGLAADHHLRIWDAVILSVASEAGCRLLLSEDLQDGFTWNSVIVVNPFAAKPNPMLVAALAAG